MTLGIIIFAVIGWIGGVHLPWWGVLISWAIGSYIIYKKTEHSGLGSIAVFYLAVSGWVGMVAGHLIMGESFTFEGLGGVLGFLFTGS